VSFTESCPLCSSSSSTIELAFPVDTITREWKRVLQIDISQELRPGSNVELWRCKVCSLRFFLPNTLAGSPAFYGSLEKFDWYYIPQKWEHDVAMQDLNGCKNGIELGCGFGSFVSRVINENGIEFEGSEQNPSAVEVARQNGIPVHFETEQNLAQSRPGHYSAVCVFQVLEHVARPADFLRAACGLLHTGGKLMIGLPNAQSFLAHQFNVLDMPPHHLTRWTAEVLCRLPRWFPLKLVRIANEPLSDYHVDGYVDAYARLIARYGFPLIAKQRVQSLVGQIIRKSGVQKLLRGQTIYACYTRL
jgi:SAM-dependent methyltransferase